MTELSRDQLLDRIDTLQARVAELEALLGADDVQDISRVLGLSRCQAMMIALLLRRPSVSRGQFMTFLYADRPDPPQEKIIDVYLGRIRKRLTGQITIETLWGVGWLMPAEDKDRLRKTLAEVRS